MELTANSAHAQPCISHGCDISSANPPAVEAPDEETDLEAQVSCSSVQPPTPELTWVLVLALGPPLSFFGLMFPPL